MICRGIGKQWLHIRPDGTPAYEERYDWVGDFHEGLAEARKDGKAFHIGRDGKPAYKERFNSVWPFSNGIAKVRKGGHRFYIRPDCTRVEEGRKA